MTALQSLCLSLTCHALSVLGVQGLVDLVKQVEGGRVALLDGEDEGQGHQRLLTPGQLLHVTHLGLVAREGHLGEDTSSIFKIK